MRQKDKPLEVTKVAEVRVCGVSLYPYHWQVIDDLATQRRVSRSHALRYIVEAYTLCPPVPSLSSPRDQ